MDPNKPDRTIVFVLEVWRGPNTPTDDSFRWGAFVNGAPIHRDDIEACGELNRCLRGIQQQSSELSTPTVIN